MQRASHSFKLPTLLRKRAIVSYLFWSHPTSGEKRFLFYHICVRKTYLHRYMRWNSFYSNHRKSSLISAFVHRALAICSKSTLQAELVKILSIFLNSGYPDHVVNLLTKNIRQFNTLHHFGLKKCLWPAFTMVGKCFDEVWYADQDSC